MGEKKQTFIQRHTYNGKEEYVEGGDQLSKEYSQQELNEAAAVYKSFYEETSGDARVLIDEYAKSLLRQNTELAQALSLNPNYRFGKVSHTCSKFKWDSNNDIQESSMIDGIVQIMATMSFDKDASGMVIDQTNGLSSHVHTELVKFIKALTIGQISPNEKFSMVVGKFTNAVVDGCLNGLYYPIEFDVEGPLQQVVLDDLNNFLYKILQDNNIEYTAIAEVGKKKSKKKKVSTKVERVEGEVVSGGSALQNLVNASVNKEVIVDV